MSLGVVRIGDKCTGHGIWPPRACDTGSGDVFVNNIAAHRQGDHWVTHCGLGCHDSTLSGGSSTVYVNGSPIGRIGDTVSCGSVAAQGSPSVFAG